MGKLGESRPCRKIVSACSTGYAAAPKSPRPDNASTLSSGLLVSPLRRGPHDAGSLVQTILQNLLRELPKSDVGPQEKNQPRNEDLRRFRAEAAALLGIQDEVKPKKD